MTFFYNKSVFFTSFFRRNHKKRSSKQVGIISDAIGNLNRISEDITVSVQKDKAKILALRIGIDNKNSIKYDNLDMVKKFDNILL